MQSLVSLHMIIIMMIDDTNQILANFKGAGIRRGGRELTQVCQTGLGRRDANWLAREPGAYTLIIRKSDRSGSARM